MAGRSVARLGRRSYRLLLLLPAVSWLAACAAAPKPEPEQRERIERALRDVPDDPIVQARVEAVEAARAREAEPQLIDEVELRVGNDYLDEDHQLRAMARLPINRLSETNAEKSVRRAETNMALSRLEETSLERRAEMCFPAIESLASEARREINADYAAWQQVLLAWNADWRGSGTINELSAARFELESRIKLAAWEPTSLETADLARFSLPQIGSGSGTLVRTPELVRNTVRSHHPGAALQRATSDRYRALSARARARNQPWLKFVDLRYEYRTDKHKNGVGGELAFEVPLGGHSASTGRYEALLRETAADAKGRVEDQVSRSLQALEEVQEFESRTEDWKTLQRLADDAEAVANRWWQKRLAKPSDVAALLDEAFAARSTVVDARERAGTAQCALLAMTGVPLEEWPRAAASR